MNNEKIHILLIEDDEDDYLLTRDIIRDIPGKSYQLTWINSYEKGVEVICDEVYEIAIVDYRLGAKTGIELMQAAAQKGCRIPIIMLTGEGDDDIDTKALEAGANDYLNKAKIDAEILERSIRYALSRYQASVQRDELIHAQYARHEAEVAQKRLQFLADASEALASTLDYETVLEKIPFLAIPTFTEWCFVHIIEDDGTVRHLPTACANPRMQPIARQLDKECTFTNKNFISKLKENPKYDVRKSLYQTIDESWFTNIDLTQKQQELLKKIHPHSQIVTPIISHDKVIGYLSFIRTHTLPLFTKHDVLLAEDLSRRIAIAIENTKLYTNAQNAIAVRDEFLNIASHELKTPLTSLQLQSQLLTRKAQQAASSNLPVADIKGSLHAMDEQITRLNKLINDLLNVSRIRNKGMELDIEQVNLSDLVQEITQRFSEQVRASKSTLIVNNHVNAVGQWDRFKIDQVITNLLSNAIKYGAGKPITLTLEKNKRNARIIIADKGIGMSDEDKKRIFNRFERSHNAQKYGGLGLGLYIAQQITRAHGGEILVESMLDKGSTFIVELPLRSSPS